MTKITHQKKTKANKKKMHTAKDEEAKTQKKMRIKKIAAKNRNVIDNTERIAQVYT